MACPLFHDIQVRPSRPDTASGYSTERSINGLPECRHCGNCATLKLLCLIQNSTILLHLPGVAPPFAAGEMCFSGDGGRSSPAAHRWGPPPLGLSCAFPSAVGAPPASLRLSLGLGTGSLLGSHGSFLEASYSLACAHTGVQQGHHRGRGPLCLAP